ncbi:MAG TPA: calcium-binding protein, partial [Rhodocyclaceae bacterium]|nr:calcium-binding protein [Rhodocyclaceae bacterium]
VIGDSAGTDTVNTTLASLVLATGIETLVYSGAGNFAGTGNAANNTVNGGVGNDTLSGAAGNDSLVGAGGHDSIDGGGGDDTLAGGTGNDTYVVDSLLDVVTEAAGSGTDTIRTGLASYATLASEVENLAYTGAGDFTGTGNTLDNVITGGSGRDTLSGGVGNDSLVGAAGNDSLDGGSGSDTLAGGLGDDSYLVDVAGDAVTEAPSEGTDTVRTALGTYVLGSNLESLIYTGGAAFVGTGNTLDNVLAGGGGNDSLDGAAGADTLNGGGGNDSLGGSSGDDSLDGGGGSDAMTGGLGNDAYVVDSTGDSVGEAPGEGTDAIYSALAALTLPGNVENLVYTGGGNFSGVGNALENSLGGGGGQDTLQGDAGRDTLDGGLGNDSLDGGSGDDSLSGGGGNDIYVVDSAGDLISEAAAAGIDTLRTANSAYTLPANVEILVFTGLGSFVGTGNAAANTVSGGTGNDTLDGDGGVDLMIGGAGDDVYRVDDPGDQITELAGEGIDLVLATAAYTLGAEIENLNYVGLAAFAGVGNAGNNVLTGAGGADSLTGSGGHDTLLGAGGQDSLDGGVGDDSLDGGAGNDTLAGGAGDDTYLVDSSGDVVTEDPGGGIDTVRVLAAAYILGGNVENLSFAGTGAFAGTGDAQNNLIAGGGGNDTLNGAAGADTMAGGAGDDTYYVDDPGDAVVELGGEGIDTLITTSATFTLGANVENLVILATGDLGLTGNELSNVLTGGTGNDTLDGGSGTDTLNGGVGNDSYVLHDGSVVIEAAGGGTDAATYSGSFGYTMATNLENLTLAESAGNVFAIGNGDHNRIDGNDGANWLDGGVGNDTLNGYGGADVLFGGAGNDLLDGGRRADRMEGGLGDDTYVVDNYLDLVIETSGAGADTVQVHLPRYVLPDNVEVALGDGADNTLVGNALANVLTGGGGRDSFVFPAAPVVGAADLITDFTGGTDHLVVDDAWTGWLPAGFLQSGAGAVALAPDVRFIYNATTGDLYYDADGSAAAAALKVATLGTGTHPAFLTTGDFSVV